MVKDSDADEVSRGRSVHERKPATFDFAIDPAKRRTKNDKKVGRPKGTRPKVAHVRRGSVDARNPMHVTLRLARGLPDIRYVEAARVIENATAKANGRFGPVSSTRLEYSLEPDHIHLLAEIDVSEAEWRREGRRWVREVKRALGKALEGLQVRIARGLSRLWNRRGPVFGDRYHVRELRTPRAVRNARDYVRRNAHHLGT